MTKKANMLQSNLDLGLTGLLEPIQDSAAVAHEEQADCLVVIEPEVTDSFQKLAREQQWPELIACAETAIASGDSAVARLWWLRAQLAMKSMPISLLVPPLATLCRCVVAHGEMSELRSALLEIATLMNDRLEEQSDDVCRQELADIVTNFDLSGTELQSPAEDSSFGLREVNRAATEGTKSGLNVNVDCDSGRRRILPILMLGLMVVAFVLFKVPVEKLPWLESLKKPVSPTLVADPMLKEQNESVSFDMPDVFRRVDVSGLGALKYDFSDDDVADKHEGKGMKPAQKKSIEQKKQPSLTIDSPNERGARKETIDTSGPIEGFEFHNGIEAGRKMPVAAKLPVYSTKERLLDGGVLPNPFGNQHMMVIDATRVYRRRNVSSEVLGQLLIGDKILVEGKYGGWARIRSKKGRTGYVAVDSLGALEDFTAP